MKHVDDDWKTHVYINSSNLCLYWKLGCFYITIWCDDCEYHFILFLFWVFFWFSNLHMYWVELGNVKKEKMWESNLEIYSEHNLDVHYIVYLLYFVFFFKIFWNIISSEYNSLEIIFSSYKLICGYKNCRKYSFAITITLENIISTIIENRWKNTKAFLVIFKLFATKYIAAIEFSQQFKIKREGFF